MTVRIILGIVALASVSVCGLLATFNGFEMIRKVNDKLPEADRFAELGWNIFKTKELFRKYRLFYPEGKLMRRRRILTAAMIICGVIAGWALAALVK
jgi:hypothetical protein